MKYIEQYKELHKADADYGASAYKYIDEISAFIDNLKPESILDYGCGKSSVDNLLMAKYPHIKIYQYDPAIEEYNTLPISKADMVICQDVLEHVPEAILPEVIKDIRSISEHAYFYISHSLSGDILPNGEDAHCTIKEPEWFCSLIKKSFDTVTLLKGRYPWQSCITTFEVSQEAKKQYYMALAKNFQQASKIILSHKA